MHPSRDKMSERTHLWLRIGAFGLLVMMAVWPRTKTGVTAAELASGGRDVRAQQAAPPAPPFGLAFGTARKASVRAERRPEPARSLSTASGTKLVVADADESHLTN